METETLAAAQQIDFSLLALFFRATLTVKLVMLVLIGASFWSWAIIIQKILDLRRAKDEAAAFDQDFWSGEPLDVVYERIGPDPVGGSARVFAAGMTEWRRSHRKDGGLIAGTQARIERAMNVAIQRESDALTNGLNFLATVGLDRALRRPLRHGLGHQARLRGDRAPAVDEPRRRRARHRRGAARHRARPARRDPGGRSSTTSSARTPTR